jgi:PAS domain S-box-containing protein
VHPADKEFFSHHCELCNTEEKSYEIEFRIVRKDGTVAWVSHACRPVQGKGGLRLGRRVSNREITDRKRIETILQESEERYRTVVNAITENLSVIDSEGKFLFANHQATRNISRGSFSDITGRNIWEFVPPDIADQIIENYRRVITSGQPFECEVRVILGGKERWFYNHLIPFTFQPGEQRCVLSVSFDITDQKRTEEALDLARKKLHVLHEMTVNEITEAIFAQKGYLELAKRLNKDSNLVLYLDRQTQNIEKISAILSFCSNYQDLGASPPRWHDLHQTFLLALSHLPMPALTRHIDLDGLEIYADPFLEKVLVVLVENVLFYAPTATMLSLTHRETGEELVVTIEDDGPGIPTEEKEKIFERGFGKNTGLGLFLSREILSITGITIRETGELGKGARFEVMVPEGMWRDSKRLPAALPVG